MKTSIILKHIFLSIIMALAIGCNPEDGEDGAIGPQGEQGIQGNANVLVLKFNLTLGPNSSRHEVEVPELTEAVLNNDLVLTFLKPVEPDPIWYSIPAASILIGDDIKGVRVKQALGLITMDFYAAEFPLGASILNAVFLDELKVVIAKGSEITGKSTTNIRAELKAAGVDITNYYEVMDYFGIAH